MFRLLLCVLPLIVLDLEDAKHHRIQAALHIDQVAPSETSRKNEIQRGKYEDFAELSLMEASRKFAGVYVEQAGIAHRVAADDKGQVVSPNMGWTSGFELTTARVGELDDHISGFGIDTNVFDTGRGISVRIGPDDSFTKVGMFSLMGNASDNSGFTMATEPQSDVGDKDAKVLDRHGVRAIPDVIIEGGLTIQATIHSSSIAMMEDYNIPRWEPLQSDINDHFWNFQFPKSAKISSTRIGMDNGDTDHGTERLFLPGITHLSSAVEELRKFGCRPSNCSLPITIHTKRPTLKISDIPNKINSKTMFTAIFTFSEDVAGFDIIDVTVTGGSKGNLSGGGTTYKLPIAPDGDADVTVGVRANSVTNAIGSTGPISAISATAIWDATPLDVTISVPNAINPSAEFTTTFTFGETVTGFETEDISVAGDMKRVLSRSNSTYTMPITPTASEKVVVKVARNSEIDDVDNTGPPHEIGIEAMIWNTPTVDLKSPSDLIVEGEDVTMAAILSSTLSGDVTIPATIDYKCSDVCIEDRHSGASVSTAITISAGDLGGTSTISTTADSNNGDERPRVVMDTGNLSSGVRADVPNQVAVTAYEPKKVEFDISPETVYEGEDVTVTVRFLNSQTLSSDVTIPFLMYDQNWNSGKNPVVRPQAPKKLEVEIKAGTVEASGTLETIIDGSGRDEEVSVVFGTLPPEVKRVTAGRRLIIKGSKRTVTLSASPNPVFEGSPGGVAVTAELSYAHSQEVRIPLTYRDKTAPGTSLTAEPTDYDDVDFITISADSTTGTETIAIPDEAPIPKDSEDETFMVVIDESTLQSDLIAGLPKDVEITIRDNDKVEVNLELLSPGIVLEGENPAARIEVKISEILPNTVAIPLLMTQDLPTSGQSAVLCPAVIKAGEKSTEYEILRAVDDDDKDEQYTVTLDPSPPLGTPSSCSAHVNSWPVEVLEGSDNSVTFTIQDRPVVKLTASPTTQNEGDSVEVKLELSYALEKDVSIDVNAAPRSDPLFAYTSWDDFETLWVGGILIPKGTTIARDTVVIKTDFEAEPDEVFNVGYPKSRLPDAVRHAEQQTRISLPGIPCDDVTCAITIKDVEPEQIVTLSASPNPVFEGNSTTLTMTLTKPLPKSEVREFQILSNDPDSDANEHDIALPLRHAGPWNVRWFRFGEDKLKSEVVIEIKDDGIDDEGDEKLIWQIVGFTNTEVKHACSHVYSKKSLCKSAIVIKDPVKITVTPSAAITMAEGGTATFGVSLSSAPSSDVTVAMSGLVGTDLTAPRAGGSSLIFTPTNYSTPQEITLVAANDDDDVKDDDVTLTLTGSDAEYDGVTTDVTVTIEDNDVGAIIANPSDVKITEGSTATFDVSLSARPSTNVTVELSGHAGTDLGTTPPDPQTIIFTPHNYTIAQSVTLTADEDTDFLDRFEWLSLDASNAEYDGVQTYVGILIDDNDALKITIDEGSSVEALVLSLPTKPTSDVTATITGYIGTALGTIPPDPQTIIFTPHNYTIAQSVTLTADEDDDIQNDVVMLVAEYSGGDYGGQDVNIEVTIRDNDAVPPIVDIDMPARINSAAPLTASFTFDKSVTGFVLADDVTVTGGTAGALSGSGSSYSLPITPSGGSDVVVTVAANSVTDDLGNSGPATAVSKTATWDAAVPTLAIGGVPGKINSTTAFTASFTFSEDVTGFVAADVGVTGGAASGFTGSGASYSATITPTGNADVVVSVDANSATDGVNLAPASEVSKTATWDVAAPRVTMVVPPWINSAGKFTVNFTFNKIVTGFEAADIRVIGGTAGALIGSGAIYRMQITTPGGSDVLVTVKANSVTDNIGNSGPATEVTAIVMWDAAPPTVDIDMPTRINSTTAFTANFMFDRTVRGFVARDVSVSGGTRGALSGSGSRYRMSVTPSGGSNVVVTVGANRVFDNDFRNGPATAVSKTAVWDAAVPTVDIAMPTRINSTAPLTASFTFDKAVTGFVLADDVTVSGGTAGALTGSGSSYSLPITPTGGSNVVVTVASNSVTDDLGNSGPVTDISETATWDAAPPRVRLIIPDWINNTDAFTVYFMFNKMVTGFAAADITVTGGTAGALTGSGASYTLPITPAGGEDVVVTVAANSVTDNIGNSGPSPAVTKTATWDAAPPTVDISMPARINSAAAFTASFMFDRTVGGFEAADITVTGGTAGALSGSGASYTLPITPAGGSDVVVTVGANRVFDYSFRLGPSTAVTATAIWDASAPTVDISVPARINSAVAFTATFTFDKAVTGFEAADITVTGGTAGALSGSGASYTLPITPAGGSDVVVTVAANSVTDQVGNLGPVTAVTATATWDAAAPTLAITGVPSKINSTTAFTATFTFDKAVTGFVLADDVTVTGGTAGALSGSGASYTLPITPSGGADVVVTVAANSVTDQVGNLGPSTAVTATAVWDASPPTVDISMPARINSTAPLTATFTFDKAVTGFEAADITVTGGTAGALTGSGASYTLPITPSGGADVVVTVSANSVTDQVGNLGPSTAVTATAVWDASPPTVDISMPARINSTAPLTATFTFDKAVTGFEAADITVTGGTAGALTGSGASYTLPITPAGGSDVVVTVAANSVTDQVGNLGPVTAVTATATWDALAPTLAITGVPSKINSTAPLTATFTFDKAVTGFEAADITVTGGTAGALTGSGASYTLPITPSGGADVVVTVSANSVTDDLGNSGPVTAVTATAVWDASPPTVDISMPARINSTAPLTATFTFDKAVTGFEAADITVTGGTAGALTGSGASYTLPITPAGGSDVVVTVAANSVTDQVGNLGPVTAVTATATWDALAPTLAITGVPSKINSTAPLTATFTFDKAVTGFEAADITVTGGTAGALTGSGASYTLPITPSGGADVVVTVSANSVTDDLGNSGPVTAVTATAVWDASPPTVDISMPARINSTAPLTATFTFDKAVTGFEAADITVTGGTAGALTGSGASYTLPITPAGGSDVVVTVAANSVTDQVGNLGPVTAVTATATWDALAPTLAITGVPSKINSTTAFTATFTFDKAVTGFVLADDVTVIGGTAGALSGSGASYTLPITPSGGADVVVTVAANSVTDQVGNLGPSTAVTATAVWDASPPTVDISMPARINSTAPLTATFTFDKAVTGFEAADITVTGGTAGALTGSGASYTLPITPSGGADVVVTVSANSVTDQVGNLGPSTAVTATAVWDASPPTVDISMPARINSTAPLTATFTFDKAVTGFEAADITVTGGTAGALTGSGASYTLPITPAGGSDVVVTVAANSVTDQVGNLGPVTAVTATATWDALAPTLAITGVPSKINSTTAFTATFTFDKAVTGFVLADDVTVIGGTAGALSGSGASYTLPITPSGGADVVVTVSANSVTDDLGNSGPVTAVTATAVWDASPPTVDISMPARINSTAPLTATFTFDKAVTGFVLADDVTVTGGTAGALTGSGASYTLPITPAGGSDVVVTVAANSVTDQVGNLGPVTAVTATATWDALAPTLAITGVPSKINSTTAFTATFTFNKAVTGFVLADDVTVIGGTAGALSGSGASYTLPITPSGGADVVVTVSANSVTDDLGNSGPVTAVTATATWDASPPTVDISMPARINSTAPLTATFTFDKAVTGFEAADITVTGGTAGALTGSGASYTLPITPAGGSDVVVTVAANSVTDQVGNLGPVTAVTATAVWDASPPTVDISMPARINSTAPLTATFTFDKAVTGFEAADITVTGGTAGALTGSGASYTLPITPSGGADVVVTVSANSVTDDLGNSGPVTAVTATATWDAAAPTLAITGVPSKINSTTAFTATFTFDKAVTGFEAADITVTGGTAGALTGSGASYTLPITPAGGSDVVVTVAANSVTDQVGNLGPVTAVTATATWDALAPTLAITGVPSKINSTTAFTATFTFDKAVTGFVLADDVTVIGGTAGALSGSGASYTLPITPSGGADVVVTVSANSVTDDLGNSGPVTAVTATAVWDASPPTVDISMPARINSTAPLTATFTFDKAVTGFVLADDVTVTGGTAGALTGSGASYTLPITPAGGSDVVVTVAANSVTDQVGNLGPVTAVTATATWDALAPTLAITGVPSKINSTTAFTATFTFDKAVTGFEAADITVTGGTAGALTGSGASYTLPITPSGGADVVVTVSANSVTDDLGNSGPVTAVTATATWDALAPTLAITGVPSKINSTTAFTATFTFDKAVTGFVLADDVTVTGGTAGALSGSGASYTLPITPSGGADVVVTVSANSVTDDLGNLGPVTAVTATAVWDASPPTVDIAVPARINSTAAFTASFTFDRTVRGFLASDVTVTGGAKGALSGSGASYTLPITPAGGADVVVTVSANSVTDDLGNYGPVTAVTATATWDDDEIPVRVSLSASLDEVEEGNPVTITVTMTGPRNTDVIIPLAYTSVGDDPAEEEDYTKLESITIPRGELGASENLATTDDETAENDETFTVAIDADQLPDRVEAGINVSAEITILDNDSPPPAEVHLSVPPGAVEEGGEVTVTVALPEDKEITSDLTIPLVVKDVSAGAQDYEAPVPVEVRIKMGEEQGTYRITITDDDIAEEDETFTVAFGELPSEVEGGDPESVTVTIRDNDQAGIAVPPSASVVEGGEDGFAFSLTSEPEGEVTVNLTGHAGTDLTLDPVRRTFTPENWREPQPVTLRAAEDLDREDDPVVVVMLNAIGGGYTGITETIQITILENDHPGIKAPVGTTVPEGESTTIGLALVTPPSGSVTLTVPNAVEDLTVSVTQLTFTPDTWDTEQTITLTAGEDDDFADDPVTLTLSTIGGEYTGITRDVRVTIIDNDEAQIVAADAIEIEEGEAEVLMVGLSAEPSGEVTVDLGGHVGTDLRLDRTSLTFTPDTWKAPQTVMLTAAEEDTDYDNDEVALTLTATGGGYDATHTTQVTILDNDEAPLSISIFNDAGLENEGRLQLRIQLNRSAEEAVTVRYATSDQTAVEGDDYTASQGIVIFDPGATRGVVEIEIMDDDIPEEQETFSVTLSNPTNAEIDRGVGIGTIQDDDGSAKLRVDDARVSEEEGRVQFRVVLSHPQPAMVSAEYRTQDGTARAGEDYEAMSGVVILAPGVMEAMIAVPILKDGLDWREETFHLHLVSAKNAEITKAVGVATIEESTTVSEGVLQAYAARFVRTVSAQITEALGDRFRSPADGAACGAVQRAETTYLWHSRWDPSLGELLSGCRVSQSRPLARGSFGVWGRGAFRQFNSRSPLTLSGEVTTGMFGADYRWRTGWLAGVLLAHSQGEGSFEVHQQSGEITAALTGVYPYVSYTRRGMDVWLSAGAGRGTAEVLELKGDLVSRFGSMGVRGDLASRGSIGLSYQGDVLVTDATIAEHDITAEVYRVRAGLEASARITSDLRPYIEANVRQDGGSAETGIGLELGGGLRVAYPAWRLRAEVHTQRLVLHTADGFTEWGLSGSLQVGGGSQGLMMRLRPSWGRAQGMSMYRQQTILDAVQSGANPRRTELELGYGIPWKEGTFRSVVGMTQLQQGMMYRVGGEFHPWEQVRFSLSGLAQVRDAALGNVGVNVQGSLRY